MTILNKKFLYGFFSGIVALTIASSVLLMQAKLKAENREKSHLEEKKQLNASIRELRWELDLTDKELEQLQSAFITQTEFLLTQSDEQVKLLTEISSLKTKLSARIIEPSTMATPMILKKR